MDDYKTRIKDYLATECTCPSTNTDMFLFDLLFVFSLLLVLHMLNVSYISHEMSELLSWPGLSSKRGFEFQLQ